MNFHQINLTARYEFNNLRKGEQKRFYIAFTRDELYVHSENSEYTNLYNGPGYYDWDAELDEELEEKFFIYFFLNFCVRIKTQSEIKADKKKRNEHYRNAMPIQRAQKNKFKQSKPAHTNTLHDLGPAAVPFLQGMIQAKAEDEEVPAHYGFEPVDAGMMITNKITGASLRCPLFAYGEVRKALAALT